VIEIKLDAAAWDGAQDNTQALLEKWLVKENEKVKKGQVLVTVVMVKATIDIEAPTDGYIEKIMIPNGESFALGARLATFENSDI
jgi:pyruvate/2-oxoglutarate dehydrogenase complex dihydrolipoamide acyltransferase (E2) component